MILLPRAVNTIQPAGAAGLDLSNPVTQGIDLAYDGNEFVNHASKKPVTPTGGPVTYGALPWKQGIGRAFAITNSDVVTTDAKNSSLVVSYIVQCMLEFSGGGTFGRLFGRTQATGTAEQEHLSAWTNNTTLGWSKGFSTSGGTWTFSNIPANTWMTIILQYDGSSTSNTPRLWVDGTEITASLFTAPSGSAINNTSNILIGNNSTGTRNWGGRIGMVVKRTGKFWSDRDVRSLSINPWQVFAKPRGRSFVFMKIPVSLVQNNAFFWNFP